MDGREIGRLEARVDALEADMAELRADVKSILAILNQAKGSWKTMVAISAFSASIGGLVMKLLPLTWTLPK